MALTSQAIFAVRATCKIPLPDKILEMIGKLRKNPVPFKPRVQPNNRSTRSNASSSENWREAKILEFTKINKYEDQDYKSIVSLTNNITTTNYDEIGIKILKLVEKRDEEFRLLVSLLLFKLAIKALHYTDKIAHIVCKLNNSIPEISEDFVAQVSLFSTLYDTTETLECPEGEVSAHDERLEKWVAQRTKKELFAKFIMRLFENGVIPEESVIPVLKEVISGINEASRKPKHKQIIEDVKAFSIFLLESSKNVKGSIKEFLKENITSLIALTNEEAPNMHMLARVKLELALKELNKED